MPANSEGRRSCNRLDALTIGVAHLPAFQTAPHVTQAWIDASKCDEYDEQVGVVGHQIPCNRHFYEFEPPRDLAEIDADLDVLSAKIMEMLWEVHS